MKALWPEMWSVEYLEDRRSEIGPDIFEQMYMCNIESLKQTSFRHDLFRACFSDDHILLPSLSEAQRKDIRLVTMGVDLASTGYFVIFVLGLMHDYKRIIIDIYRDSIPYPAQKDLIFYKYLRYNPVEIRVENNALQNLIVQDLQAAGKSNSEVAGMPITGHHTGTRKYNPVDGVPSLVSLLQDGALLIPRGDVNSIRKTNLLIDEAIKFPRGKTSDILMALWFAETAVRGFITTHVGAKIMEVMRHSNSRFNSRERKKLKFKSRYNKRLARYRPQNQVMAESIGAMLP